MIAITGANGQLGRLVIAELFAQGAKDVRALVRSPEKAVDLAGDGVTLAEFNYDDAQTHAPALAGVDKLLLISGSEIGKRTPQHLAVIDSAKKAGVKLIAYTSVLNAGTSPMILAEEHRATENALASSGIDHVILRNGWYLENFAGSVGAALEHGAIAGASGDGKFAAAARKDYADAAVAVLLAQSTETRTYELAGSEPFTMSEFAATLSELTGREIPFANMPQSDYGKLLEGAGLPPAFAAILADSDFCASNGALMGDSSALEALIGRKTLTHRDFIQSMLSA